MKKILTVVGCVAVAMLVPMAFSFGVKASSPAYTVEKVTTHEEIVACLTTDGTIPVKTYNKVKTDVDGIVGAEPADLACLYPAK